MIKNNRQAVELSEISITLCNSRMVISFVQRQQRPKQSIEQLKDMRYALYQ